MRKHSHAMACILDTAIRHSWYGQHRFALSEALKASARNKKHDSSRERNRPNNQLKLI